MKLPNTQKFSINWQKIKQNKKLQIIIALVVGSLFLLYILYLFVKTSRKDNRFSTIYKIIEHYYNIHEEINNEQEKSIKNICNTITDSDSDSNKILFIFKFIFVIIALLLYLIYYLTLYPILNIIRIIIKDPIYLFFITLTITITLLIYQSNILDNILKYSNNLSNYMSWLIFLAGAIIILFIIYITPLAITFLNSISNNKLTFHYMCYKMSNEKTDKLKDNYKEYYNNIPGENFNIFKFFSINHITDSKKKANKDKIEAILNKLVEQCSESESVEFFNYVKNELDYDPYEMSMIKGPIFKKKFKNAISKINGNISDGNIEFIKRDGSNITISRHFTIVKDIDNIKIIDKDKNSLEYAKPYFKPDGYFSLIITCLCHIIILTLYLISYVGINCAKIIIGFIIFCSPPCALIVKAFTFIFSDESNIDDDLTIKKYLNAINNGFSFFYTSKIKYLLFVSFIIILGVNSWLFFGKIGNYYANETLSYLGGTTATILAVLLLLLSNSRGSKKKDPSTEDIDTTS